MTGRQASVLVSDDILISLQGKFTVIGVYTADISIPEDGTTAPQLAFLFVVECGVDDRIESLTLEVKLPGNAPEQQVIPIVKSSVLPGRTKLLYKLPFLIIQPVLHPGRIEAKIIHEKGEIPVAGPWISLVQPAEKKTQ